jgi:hypothetical protein
MNALLVIKKSISRTIIGFAKAVFGYLHQLKKREAEP